MCRYPLLIAGPKNIDSQVMQASEGKLIAKGGAEGMMMVSNLETQEVLIIKIMDGSNRAKPTITLGFLEELGWLEP